MHRTSVNPRRLRIPSPAVGLSWRAAFAGALLRDPGAISCVEVVAEACFARPDLYDEARALATIWPVVVHSIHLSLGSASGIDVARARRVARLAKDLGAVAVTEHIAFTKTSVRDIGHLTPLPRTPEAVAVVAHNVATLRAHLDVPLWLENIAAPLSWPDDSSPDAFASEGAFITAIVEQTGCPLMLDLANLHANALNAGVPLLQALQDFPLERVAMLHIAGGCVVDDDDGRDAFYCDTHGDPVAEEVFAALPAVGARAGAVPVILERDHHIPPLETLLGELGRARAALGDAPAHIQTMRPGAAGALSPALAARQAALADALTVPGSPAPDGFPARELGRAAAILERKRVDDAVALLPGLGQRPGLGALARAALAGQTRPRHGVTASDAMVIAAAIAQGADPGLARTATADLDVLRARFVADGDGVRPRSRLSRLFTRARRALPLATSTRRSPPPGATHEAP